MTKRYLTTRRWLITLSALMLASMGWSAYALWAEIAARQPHAGRAIFGAIYSLGVIGWAALTLGLWAIHRRGELGQRLGQLYFLLDNRLLLWAGMAVLWVVLPAGGAGWIL